MKRINYFAAYIIHRLALFAAAGLILLIYLIVFWLYRLPLETILYASILASGLVLSFISYDYLRFVQRIKYLQNMQLETIRLPETASPLLREYHHWIDQLFTAHQQHQTEMQTKLQGMADYYTLWAHQIKTPIAAMRLLMQEDTEQNYELQAELFKIEQYVQLILQYMKLESINQDFVLNQVQLDSVIRQSIRKYARLFIRNGITLTYEPCTLCVISDAKWLGFVLEQLLSNAIKYTNQQITILVTEDHVLKIIDDGLGIREEDLPRVFEKGYTGYNGRSQQNATGIGLYLCAKILRKLSHHISIQSVLHEGTTVSINFKQDSTIFD